MKFTIYTDGGARNNPGPAAVGVVILKGTETIMRFSKCIGTATNNQAEYAAVIFALEKAKSFLGAKKTKETELDFRLDSQLVVRQLNRQYKVRNKEIEKLFTQVWNLMSGFQRVAFEHIPREKNKEADKLVNQALDNNKQ